MEGSLRFGILLSTFTLVSIYPPEINVRLASPAFAGKAAGANAVGTSASFQCGSFVRFYLSISREDLYIHEIRFESNGCGFAVAAADRLAEYCTGRPLTELHGLAKIGDDAGVKEKLGSFPPERMQCMNICVEALRAALSAFRSLQIEEFAGEKALICTCFGIEEETIKRVIVRNSIKTVAEVTARTNAGGGCGSCRMLIQEIIDGQGVTA